MAVPPLGLGDERQPDGSTLSSRREADMAATPRRARKYWGRATLLSPRLDGGRGEGAGGRWQEGAFGVG